MAFGDYGQIFGGLFDLGGAKGTTLNNLATVQSTVLNTRDLGSVGAPDYVVLGPGAQVWTAGYSVRITSPAVLPTDALGLELELQGSFDDVAPFAFGAEQSIKLPVYATAASQPGYSYSGHVRLEAPSARFSLANLTGQNLVISFRFWGKAF